MSIIRMSAFVAREDQVGELREFLKSILPSIEKSDGCQSCRLLHSQEDPARFVVLEEWESMKAHQASVQNIAVNDVKRVIGMLAAPPTGEYFTL